MHLSLRGIGLMALRRLIWTCFGYVPFFFLWFFLWTSSPFSVPTIQYVYLKLSLPTSVHRGPGVWKLNTSHLKDLSFLLLVTQFWESWRNEKRSFHNLSAWWDAGKSRLKLLIRNFSRKKASAFRQRLLSLERTLYFLNRRAERGEDVDHLLTDVRSELEDAHHQQAKGCRIRANVQWAEEGEASTSYFFKLEQRHGQSRLFSVIRTAGGSVVSSFVLIVRAWVFFYVTLFSADVLHVGHQDFFLSHITQKLSPEQRAFCDGEVTAEEYKRALDGMVSGRSPSLDGFPAEFYRTFWPVLGQDFVEVMNFCYASGRLSSSQRSGLITLLFKRGDRLEMKNWRPITLLCVDYKIASKAIANRLLTVLPSLIHPNQTCGIKGQNPSVNHRMLQDIVGDLNSRGLGGAVLSLDQEKAFNRVDWAYLLRVLKHMNFGVSFCNWVSLFYTSISSSVLVNGEQSEPFYVARGVRQGCPLSPLLYVIMAETLANCH